MSGAGDFPGAGVLSGVVFLVFGVAVNTGGVSFSASIRSFFMEYPVGDPVGDATGVSSSELLRGFLRDLVVEELAMDDTEAVEESESWSSSILSGMMPWDSYRLVKVLLSQKPSLDRRERYCPWDSSGDFSSL